ncbi:histone H1-3 [Tasmannia lanceolata]|uniref:histone H1-3 n=1 Tax=Tasmannia lanceolata TaxID=3420 RepID=UPI004063D4A5
MSEGEVVSTMAVGPVVETQAEKPTEEDTKALKEKKATREKKPRKAKPSNPSHPPYFMMIKEALIALNEKSGSSVHAITKYMEEKHKAVLPENYKKMLSLQLKNCTARGKLIKIRASFKLSELGKKDSSTAANKKKSSKKVEKSPKAVKPAKKVGAKKAKKSAPAKPKQPKSIKSSGAKKAKKTSA